uniref:Uncharacterized protein n=1 Tax=Sphingobacterium sp. (strain 21) TaxID=743722 RepID=F4C691_SPHS2
MANSAYYSVLKVVSNAHLPKTQNDFSNKDKEFLIKNIKSIKLVYYILPLY